LSWHLYRAALLVLNRQDAKAAKIGNREWTNAHEWMVLF
jgi:hypothetical protein